MKNVRLVIGVILVLTVSLLDEAVALVINRFTRNRRLKASATL
jgi:hypothetical protein